MRLIVLIEDIGLKIKPLIKFFPTFLMILPILYSLAVGITLAIFIRILPPFLEVKTDYFGSFVELENSLSGDYFVNTGFFKDIKDVSNTDTYKAEVILENGDKLSLTFKNKELKDNFLAQLNNKERF